MPGWTADELKRIGEAEELDLASMRRDGTLRKPVTMWVVRVGDDLFVRAYKGRTSPWFVGAISHHEGHVSAGGVEKDVKFVEAGGETLHERVDAAYRSKYHRYAGSILASVLTTDAQAATIRLAVK